MFNQKETASSTSAKDAPGPQPSRKLYSMAGLLRQGRFEGDFNAQGEKYRFTFAPREATISNRKLELSGNLTVQGPRGTRTAKKVVARLAATQGGIGDSPIRRQLTTGTTGASTVSTADQQQEQAKAPELAPGSDNTRASAITSLPITESTGPLGFVAVLYLRMQSLDGAALGVPLDLKNVQLNARLAPDNDRDRDLLWTYSDLVAALAGEKPDAPEAKKLLAELNRALAGENR
jgi:hypothetical protein